MVLIAGIGLGTTLLELMATSIGFGIVIFGFVISCLGMTRGWTRRELEADALRHVFWVALRECVVCA